MFPLVLANISDATVAMVCDSSLPLHFNIKHILQGRISKFLTAEELAEPYAIDLRRRIAVDVDGDFTWETAAKRVDSGQKFFGSGGGKGNRNAKPRENSEQSKVEKGGFFGGKNGKKEPVLPLTASDGKSDDVTEKDEEEKADEKPFELNNLKFKVPKGSFVAIVGRVGSGKV
jgi:ATP-binding cassette subfamily C (CFTR/MRP) protein 1